MSSVHTPIDSPDPSILPRALQSQDFPSARSFDPNNNPPIFPLPIQEGSTNLQSCPNDAAYNTAVASTMADPPPSRARIVPIMAGRKYTAKPKAGSSSASSSRSSLRKKALKGEKLEPEELRIQCLDDRKLYASPIKGDGNCLFYALSDQVYGDTDRHLEIRARLVEHMRARPDYFIPFVADVGGERRAPRRAAAAEAKLSISRVTREATKNGQQTKFEGMMAEMEKAGVWGGSAEIQAFCQSYGRDANIYSDSGIQTFTSNAIESGEEREVVHLAFHSFQHYSSVRAVDGPHTGLPCLPRHPVDKISDVTEAKKTNGDQESKATSTAAENLSPQSVTLAEPWKISAISDALPGYDSATIREMLKKCRGDIDNAFAKLLDSDTSVSSSPPCSSVAASSASGPSSTSTTLGLSSRTIPASSSRSSSRHSTASKRSADDSEDEDDKIRSPIRRGRGRDRKRRILDGVTVGFSVRHDENGVVSFRLRVDPDASERAEISEAAAGARESPGVVTRQRGKLLRNGVKKDDTPSAGDATDSGTDGTLPPPAESASQASEVEESSGD